MFETWTSRRFDAAAKWVDAEWDRPNRSDFYVMDLHASFLRSKAKNPGKVATNKLKLKFSAPGRKKTKAEIKAEVASQQMRDLAMVGGGRGVEVRTVSREEHDAAVRAELERMRREEGLED